MYDQFLFILTTSNNSGLKVILLFIVFVLIIAAAYYVTYYIAKIQQGSKKNSNLQIVEAISIGPQKSLQLVRTGNKYVVIGVTKGNIQLLQTLGEDDVIINQDTPNATPFKQILDKYRKDEPRDSGEDHHETKDE